MHLKSLLSTTAVAAALLVAAPAFAQHDHSHAAPQAQEAAPAGQLIRVTDKDAAWAAKERATYPLKTCVVSDEKLGGMGKPREYIYRQEGKADRLVVFCCGGCLEDFNAEPAKYLAKIDAAKSETTKAGAAATKDEPSAQAATGPSCACCQS